MATLNISKARDELYKLASSCIKYNDVVNINTKDGNVIMISQDDYNSLLESLYLAGIKGVYEDIEEALGKKVDVVTIGSKMHQYFKEQLEKDKIKIF